MLVLNQLPYDQTVDMGLSNYIQNINQLTLLAMLGLQYRSLVN